MGVDTPPCAYLKIVAKQCEKALHTYLQLWERKDQDERVYIPYKQINEFLLTSKARFKHDIMLLAASMLISYELLNGVYVIELVPWDEEHGEPYGGFSA
jgi:hypothetical protein